MPPHFSCIPYHRPSTHNSKPKQQPIRVPTEPCTMNVGRQLKPSEHSFVEIPHFRALSNWGNLFWGHSPTLFLPYEFLCFRQSYVLKIHFWTKGKRRWEGALPQGQKAPSRRLGQEALVPKVRYCAQPACRIGPSSVSIASESASDFWVFL